MNATAHKGIPKVSVAMIAYNHENFIAQAIESVLMQGISFPIELVIGEDCSTDDTRQIVESYAALHPDVIRPLLHPKNVGMHGNLEAVLKACRGEYIAILEGDDYWTSPHKLQKQADFLDQHPDHSICGHRFLNVYANDPAAAPFQSPAQKESGRLEDILRWNYLLTCTVVFRAGLVTEIPEEFKKLLHADMPLWALLAQQGRVGFINEVMAAYRMHGGGVWTGVSTEAKIAALERTINAIHKHLGPRYAGLRRVSLGNRYAEFAAHYSRSGDYASARRLLMKSFFKSPAAFCTSADASWSVGEQLHFYLTHPLTRAWGWCARDYHRARIWGGANRRKLWKAGGDRPHGANPEDTND